MPGIGKCREVKPRKKDEILLMEGEEVDLIICRSSDIGVMVVINGRYQGMLYKNEVFRKLDPGDKMKGYIKKIREDGKIDVTLRKGGIEDIEEAKKVILKKLRGSVGFLPLGDDSPPELIKESLQISKKVFKKAIGGLYKEGVIELKKDGIKLKRSADKLKRLKTFNF